jgi:hypothetical protein
MRPIVPALAAVLVLLTAAVGVEFDKESHPFEQTDSVVQFVPQKTKVNPIGMLGWEASSAKIVGTVVAPVIGV